MTKLERVAREIAPMIFGSWSEIWDDRREDCREIARTAIRAIGRSEDSKKMEKQIDAEHRVAVCLGNEVYKLNNELRALRAAMKARRSERGGRKPCN